MLYYVALGGFCLSYFGYWQHIRYLLSLLAIAHVLRIGLYIHILPILSKMLGGDSCGTNKNVSGHTHMYIFHCFFGLYFLALECVVPIGRLPVSMVLEDRDYKVHG